MIPFLRVFFISMALLLTAGAQEISLFNGKDLAGWEGRQEFWSVQDGAITAKTTKDNRPSSFTSLVWRGGEVSDFEFSCDFRIISGETPGSRFGGIQFRGTIVNANYFTVGGYNVDMDYGNGFTGKLVWKMTARSCGNGILRGQKVVVTDDAAAKRLKYDITGKLGTEDAFRKAVKRDDWNQCKIVALGEHLQVFIDGVQTVDVVDRSAVVPKSGVLALSLYFGPIATFQFRNLTLKKLASNAVLADSTIAEDAMKTRVYTDKNGRTFRASLVSVNGNTVKLKGEDGRVITCNMSDLCTADTAYLLKAAAQQSR